MSTWTKSWPIIFSQRAFTKVSIWITLRLESSLLLLQTPQTSRLPARDRERAHNACLKTKRKGDKAMFPLTKQKKYSATGREILLYQLITSEMLLRGCSSSLSVCISLCLSDFADISRPYFWRQFFPKRPRSLLIFSLPKNGTKK